MLDFVNALDVKEEFVGLSIVEIEQRRGNKEELGRVLQLEEIFWRQKSRILWLKQGDCNTVFPYDNQSSQEI